MEHSCHCGGSCGCEKDQSIQEHFCQKESQKTNESVEKIERLKKAITKIGFNVEETEEGIRLS